MNQILIKILKQKIVFERPPCAPVCVRVCVLVFDDMRHVRKNAKCTTHFFHRFTMELLLGIIAWKNRA